MRIDPKFALEWMRLNSAEPGRPLKLYGQYTDASNYWALVITPEVDGLTFVTYEGVGVYAPPPKEPT